MIAQSCTATPSVMDINTAHDSPYHVQDFHFIIIWYNMQFRTNLLLGNKNTRSSLYRVCCSVVKWFVPAIYGCWFKSYCGCYMMCCGYFHKLRHFIIYNSLVHPTPSGPTCSRSYSDCDGLLNEVMHRNWITETGRVYAPVVMTFVD